jgi:hypothetical protein
MCFVGAKRPDEVLRTCCSSGGLRLLAILLLSMMSRCATPTLCPNDAELIGAIRGRGERAAAATSNEAAARGEIVLVHPRPVQGVQDVICGDRLSVNLPTVICKMTLRYETAEVFQIAKLTCQDGIWEIVEDLAVTRDRR